MMTLKKLKHTVLFAVLLSAFTTFSALAATGEPEPDPDPSSRTDISVNITSPDVYSGELEFYCDKETFYISIPSGETQTSVTCNVPKGSYSIGFLDPNDLGNSFNIAYDNHLNTDAQSTVNVTIDYSDRINDYTGDDEEGDSDYVETATQPTEFDFSEGQEYGVISITCAQYGSIDAAVYKLMGPKKVYEITLDAEHNFAANVYLPTGTYKELTSIDVTPNELATITDDLTFAWGHRNSTYYGNNYEVTTGSSTSINDLYIKMNYQGDLREVDDLILMQTKIRDNYTELVQDRREKFIENKLSDTHPTISESEESAPAIAEVSKPHNSILKYIGIGCACLFVVFLLSATIIRKKHSRKNDNFEENEQNYHI